MASVISVYDTTVFGSPDPSGLTYDPLTGQLLLVDSEVDEDPFNSTTNMFALGTDGVLDASYELTQVTPEPTGVAYNEVTGTVFVTDDDSGMVYEVDRNDPTVVLNSFSATDFGAGDIEDITVAPDGTLYILDQANRTIWHTATDGTVISSVQLPSTLKRPEALAYDPREDVFYVAGGWSADIYKVSSDGDILDKIRLLRDYPNADGDRVVPKALTLVPADDPTQGSTLWVGDYGKDQVNDGRLFEIQLDPPPPPPPPPSVAILDATPVPQIEGEGRQVAFTITLSEAVSEDVVVTYDTVDGTAVAGSDYTGVTGGTVVIAAGSTSATVFIDLINDDVIETEETFSVVIRSAEQATSGTVLDITDDTGIATVADDDADGPPQVMVYDAAAFGSPDPSGLAYVSTRGTVILVDSEVDERPFFSSVNMFNMQTDGVVSDSVAFTAVSDEPTGVAHWYDAATGRDLLFITDDDSRSIKIVDMDDPLVLLGEIPTADFGARDPEDIAVDPATGNLFVLDERSSTIFEVTQDGTLVSQIALPGAISRAEALAYDSVNNEFYVAGGASTDIYRVARDGTLLSTITVLDAYPHADGSDVEPKGLTLVPDEDGSGGMTLWVADYGADQEADGRIFTIHLDPPAPPAVAVLDATPTPQVEGEGAQVAFTFTLSRPLEEDVIVTFDTVDGTAMAGSDYVGVTGGTVVIAAGSTYATVFIDLVNDTAIEDQEAFTVAVRGATLATSGTAVEVADGSGTATVIDDDPDGPPEVLVYDATVFGSPDPSGLTYVSSRGTMMLVDSETDESPFFNSVNMFGLRTDGAVTERIPFTKVSNEPTGVAHWQDPATGQDLLFLTDDETLSVTIVAMDDPLVPIGGFSTSAFGADDPEDIAVDPVTGNLFILDGLAATIFEVTQDGTVVAQIDVSAAVADPEALAYDSMHNLFYVAGGGSSDIFRLGRDGSVLASITALDAYPHADGSPAVPKGLALVPDEDGSGGMTLWVADYGLDQTDDGRIFSLHLDPPPPPALALSDGSPTPQTEGVGAQVVFTVTLSQAMDEDVTVTVNTVDGTAVAGEDFVGVSGATLTIAAGTTSASLAVELINDDVIEDQETFTLDITSAVTASSGTAVDVADGSGTGTIADDDSADTPAVLVYDSTVFGSPDPSGLTYMSNHDKIMLADSEVTEKPFYSDINLFELAPDGSFSAGLDVTTVTKEATGVAHWYDAINGRDLLFITDDDAAEVFVVDMADPSQELWSFSTPDFGADDPEDIAIDPTTGNLFVVGESSETIYEVTQDGTLISTIVLPNEAERPEAVAYDPAEDVFYVSGYRSPDIYKVARDGTLLDTITVLRDYDNADGTNVKPKGLTLVPDDDGSGGMSLWVADYGNDQVDDGRIFVIDLDNSDVWV